MKMNPSAHFRKRNKPVIVETIVRILLGGSALVTVLTTVGIIVTLVSESYGFFRTVPLLDFLFGTRWDPLLDPKSFGVLPLLSGTLMIVFWSALIAIPMGLFTAIYLSQYASDKTRNILKPILEVLAGIPTVVYGYFALTFISPILRQIFPSSHIFNALSASIVVGIMILPMIASLSDDALKAVPKALSEGALALGAKPYEVITQVLIPGALSGIMASFVLAISRAFGETMAVTLAAGATPNLTVNPLESIQTMTAYIVQVSLGDTPAGGIEYQTIFAVGLLLFAITLLMNVVSSIVMNRFREVYE